MKSSCLLNCIFTSGCHFFKASSHLFPRVSSGFHFCKTDIAISRCCQIVAGNQS
ncbi:hypothetical protein L873DRAFT_393957 [Choiromyces venosus 120613-1]|uniref:Uncharacterized protein n=1 Tax=Choiromyces venosus 120613-1 TaxID=1336337 RepID=A0A3N4J0G5_9PEZI|nr:hypothetical protein L873DRAFT_393957 [Choiromyces venosus 120613-1]